MEEQQTLSSESFSPEIQKPGLSGVGELLKKSWQIYKSRFWTFFEIMAIPAVISFLLTLLFLTLGIALAGILKALGIVIFVLLIIFFVFFIIILTI